LAARLVRGAVSNVAPGVAKARPAAPMAAAVTSNGVCACAVGRYRVYDDWTCGKSPFDKCSTARR
jgi:hypothetical protein